MPFNLGDDPARLRPASGLIGETCLGRPHFVRRPLNGARQKVADPLLQNAVRRQSDRIFDPRGFEEVVNGWIGEASVSPKINARDLATITRHDGLQHIFPAVGAMDIAGAQGASFQIAELVENEQRMIAGS